MARCTDRKPQVQGCGALGLGDGAGGLEGTLNTRDRPGGDKALGLPNPVTSLAHRVTPEKSVIFGGPPWGEGMSCRSSGRPQTCVWVCFFWE